MYRRFNIYLLSQVRYNMKRYTVYDARTRVIRGVLSRMTKQEVIHELQVADWTEALEYILSKGLAIMDCPVKLDFDNEE